MYVTHECMHAHLLVLGHKEAAGCNAFDHCSAEALLVLILNLHVQVTESLCLCLYVSLLHLARLSGTHLLACVFFGHARAYNAYMCPCCIYDTSSMHHDVIP